MKTSFLILFLAFAFVQSKGQNTAVAHQPDIKIGDKLLIGEPIKNTYKHIHFPKPNFIIKRGGIVNYKNLVGKHVAVSSIEDGKNGAVMVKIKRVDGGKFFGSHTIIDANLKEALNSGELKKME